MSHRAVSASARFVVQAAIGLVLVTGPAPPAGACQQGVLSQPACYSRSGSDARTRTAGMLAAATEVRATTATPGMSAAGGSTGVRAFKPAPVLDPVRFPYYHVVRRIATRHSVDPRLILAIIASESGGNPAAVSPAGAIGLMQLMPSTARFLGVDPWNPVENVDGAVRYLASLLSTFRSVDVTLVAYNAGPRFAARYLAGEIDLGPETRAFLMRVGWLLECGIPADAPAPLRRP